MSRNGNGVKSVSHAGPEQPFRCLDIDNISGLVALGRHSLGRWTVSRVWVFSFRWDLVWFGKGVSSSVGRADVAAKCKVVFD